MKILKYLQKNLVYMLPIAIVIGIIAGNSINTSFLKSFILPFTFLMIYPQMVNLNLAKLFEKPNTKLKVASIVLNFIVIPLIAFGLGRIFFANSHLDAVGLFLIALLPTGSMTLAFTGLTKGNLPAAIRISVFSLLTASFLAPLYLYQFMGEVIEINFLLITKKILLVILLPLILGVITRYFVIKKTGQKDYKEKFGQKMGSVSVIGVLGMVFSVMAMKAEFIVDNPTKILFYIIPLLFFYGLNYTISTIIGKMFFNRKDALALVFGTSLRHLAIALAVAVTSFGEVGFRMAIIISIAFVFQIKIGAWYTKFVHKIF